MFQVGIPGLWGRDRIFIERELVVVNKFLYLGMPIDGALAKVTIVLGVSWIKLLGCS